MSQDSELHTACQVWRDFASLKQSTLWAALDAAGDSLFETTDWLENLVRTCPLPGELVLLGSTHRTAASLLALRRWPNGRLESLSNYYAALYGPVATQSAFAEQQAAAYAQWIADSGAPTLRLHPLDADTEFWQRFSAALKHSGFWVDRYFAFGNWYQPTAGLRWGQYLADRPSRLRHTIQRVRKKLGAHPGFRALITDAGTDPATLAQAVKDFGAVYAHSWKRPEPYPDFVPGLCQLAQARGWLRMGLCYLDDQPVAAQIWLVRDGSAAIFKLAYDQRYARHGVGTWVSAALSEYVLDVDRVREIDFLAGDDAYKSEWMSMRRNRHGLIAFNPRSVQGLLAAARHYGARKLRRFAGQSSADGSKTSR